MRIEIRTQTTGVAIVGFAGRLTAGNAVACLRDQINDLLRCNFTNIVLDMERVDLVDCAGIGQMVNCSCRARALGGRLKLVRVHQRFRDLLALFRLGSVLETYDSEQDAIGSFAASHGGAPVAQPSGTGGEPLYLSWCRS